MTDLQSLFHAIDRLQPSELEQVRQYIEQRRQSLEFVPDTEDVEARITALQAAFEELREGLSEDELKEILAAMNVEYVNPKDLHQYDWLDELPEDER